MDFKVKACLANYNNIPNGAIVKETNDIFIYLRGFVPGGSFPITQDFVNSGDHDIDALFEEGIKNAKQTAIISSLAETFGYDKDALPFDFLTTTENGGLYGAGSVLNYNLLYETYDGIDLFLIPSSIHEFIIVPIKKWGGSPMDLQRIVKEMNSTIDEKDVLSDKIYVYSAKDNMVAGLAMKDDKKEVLN